MASRPNDHDQLLSPASPRGRRMRIALPKGRGWRSRRCRANSNREYSAALITGAGTPSSIAACSVHRPSPESETRPWKFSSSGSWRNAPAVRSSSHEPTTLPRRHISATCATSISIFVVIGFAQRRSLSVHLLMAQTDIGILDDVEAFGERRHHAVLDAVMDHLDEVAGAIWAAMEIAILGLRWLPGGTRCTRRRSTPGASERKIGSRCFTIACSPPIIWQ